MEKTVTQRNFKHLREQYGIKLKDVADICNLSAQTVNNFEKCRGEYTQINARSYNGDMMINALQSIINNKIIKENIPMEKEVKHKKYNRLTDIDRSTFLIYLNSYLADNNITIKEFCNMCDLSTAQFEMWYIERNPKLSNSSVRHISNATGWSYNDIKTGAFVKAKGEKSMSYVPTSKSEIISMPSIKLNTPSPERHDIEQETHKKNIRYICDETGFYMEYDIVQHVKQPVSKDIFIKAISGREV